MANECMNYITIKGDKDLIQLFADSYLKKTEDGYYELDFNIIAPIPNNCEDDYTFRIENWGNKWDGTNGYVDFWSDDEIIITVDTAWGPCDKITYKLISLCPGLYFYHEYYEPGDGFIGWIEHQPNEGPEDYEDIFYDVSHDAYNYWFWMFEKEYETYDCLSEHVDDCVDDEIITEEEGDIIQNMIEHSSLEDLIRYCIEKEVL